MENPEIIEVVENELYEVKYGEDEDYVHFYLQIYQRDDTNKTTQCRYTALLAKTQTTPTDWTSQQWITDETAETELNEEMADPFSEWLIWLLRMIGKRHNKPFGAS